MFTNGNVTLYVADMERSVRFYTQTLGLACPYRFGNEWASIQAGNGLMIGLHPASERAPAGRRGSMAIGLEVNAPIEDVVKTLEQRGVRFDGPVARDKAGAFVGFSDPDGNPLYLAQLNWAHVDKGEGEYARA